METVIRTLDELQALIPRRARRGLRRVVLHLPGEPADLRAAEAAINRGLRSCGCETAALFLLIGLVGLGACVLGRGTGLDLTAVRTYLGLAGYAVALVVAGKVTGLVLAEWALRAAIRRLSQR
jgi:hypothetical protein